MRLDEQRMVKLAWVQLWLSLACLPVFVLPIPIAWKVEVIGVMSALTWTGTALSHISAARANRAIVEVQSDEADVEHADKVEIS